MFRSVIMRDNITKEYHKLYDSMIESLSSIVQIPSVLDDTSTSTPFGESIDQCLDKTLSICEDLGFSTYKDPEGYYGYADIGEGDELIGVLCHLDVVPVEDAEHWDSAPFTLTERDGKLFARGVGDDKAPTILCLYALRAIINLGVTLNKRFRFIFGTDEENLWRCIARYKQLEQHPHRGITPDGAFPVIIAEKGLVQFVLTGEGADFEVSGGGAFNAVPFSVDYKGANTSALVALVEELQKNHFEYTLNDDTITVIGQSAHAQSCEDGINPISRLVACLKSLGISNNAIDFIDDNIKDNPFGELLCGDIQDEVSGKLTTNLAKLEVTPEYSKIFFDFRVPVTKEIDNIIDTVKNTISKYHLTYQEHDRLGSLYIPADDPFVKQLCDIYKEETGLSPTPLTTGGATYSRMLDNFVTFGMGFPDSVHTAHQRNEFITLDDMQKAFIIYAKTFYKLNQS